MWEPEAGRGSRCTFRERYGVSLRGGGWRWSRKGEERGRGRRWLGSHCTMPSPERPPLHPLDMHFLPPTIPHELLPRFYDILCRVPLIAHAHPHAFFPTCVPFPQPCP